MLTFDRERGGTAVHWALGPITYTRVGRAVSFKAGPLTYRRIGRMWLIGWRWGS